ncbi:MAG: acetyl-CoA carboxylase biotin carboxylase subunit [Candidatus Eisenbacteria bacterium]|nr:acetyl-CoA carboxylase biotin carboxylase subunit [Candidatus Eisenbacteria bacterium]
MNKILVANRGEIALRVMKACREMGIPTVAVYSTSDKGSLHVQFADEAICIGPPQPLESYLNIEKIMGAAKQAGADAVHPGYGFLAENSDFARRCAEEGITFIGPNHEAMRLLGNKVESRKTMVKAGIPVIPGMMGGCNDAGSLAGEANQMGYPVLVKAAGGGGGKGMRIVRDAKELEDSLAACMREARSAFGDDTIYLEKYIERPRHIEFQILADTQGNVVHLFERECSIQRRYQKIVEETPSVALGGELREKMGNVAVQVARTAGYTNAGTVEFLLDQAGKFYFLEVNARVQVEHPITEAVVGVDLVKQQIRVASGERLSLKQEDLRQRGHAIECRIYAEDPENGFLPCAGKILFVKEPAGPGIRCDSGIWSGCEVSVHYDPILSKLVVWDETREQARRRMASALRQYVILGIKTTIPFLADVMEHPAFAEGRTHTGFIPEYFSEWKPAEGDPLELKIALLAAALGKSSSTVKTGVATRETFSPWKSNNRWRIAGTG